VLNLITQTKEWEEIENLQNSALCFCNTTQIKFFQHTRTFWSSIFSRNFQGLYSPLRYARSWDKSNGDVPSVNISAMTHLGADKYCWNKKCVLRTRVHTQVYAGHRIIFGPKSLQLDIEFKGVKIPGQQFTCGQMSRYTESFIALALLLLELCITKTLVYRQTDIWSRAHQYALTF